MLTIKEQCEAIWRAPELQQRMHVCIWEEGVYSGIESRPGEERAPTVGKSAEKFMRRVRKHWGPEPMAYYGTAKMKMPEWVRENYKRNCPNNYADLIRLYGKLDAIDEALGQKS